MHPAEDLTTALGMEFALMAEDPVVQDMKRFLLSRYRLLGADGLDPRSLIATSMGGEAAKVTLMMRYQDAGTGTNFYILDDDAGRRLMFIIKRKELESR